MTGSERNTSARNGESAVENAWLVRKLLHRLRREMDSELGFLDEAPCCLTPRCDAFGKL